MENVCFKLFLWVSFVEYKIGCATVTYNLKEPFRVSIDAK